MNGSLSFDESAYSMEKTLPKTIWDEMDAQQSEFEAGFEE